MGSILERSRGPHRLNFDTSTRARVMGSITRKEQNYEETTMWGKNATRNTVSGIGDLEH
jgi:hypothetical protein